MLLPIPHLRWPTNEEARHGPTRADDPPTFALTPPSLKAASRSVRRPQGKSQQFMDQKPRTITGRSIDHPPSDPTSTYPSGFPRGECPRECPRQDSNLRTALRRRVL